MEYSTMKISDFLVKSQDNKKQAYMAPIISLLEFESQDIASGGPNPGPDGTFGNNS